MRITRAELLRRRQQSQGLVRLPAVGLGSPQEVADRLLALQGQDLPGALWSLGLRSGTSRSEVTAAFDAGTLVRTWPFRGTLHVIAARDAAWVLALTGRRTITSAAKRHRDLGLDDGTVEKAREVAVEHLQGGRRLSRRDLMALFDRHGIDTGSQRGVHLLWSLCLTGTLVLGPFDGDEQLVVLLDEWVPAPRALGREEALAEIVIRYLAGRGPATEADIAWWAKLPLGDVREGLAVCGSEVARIESGDRAYLAHTETMDVVSSHAPREVLLLPGFDELLLGYADRGASLAPQHAPLTVPGGNGVFKPTVVSRGRVVGLWSRRSTAARTVVTATPFAPPFPTSVVAALRRQVAAYGAYLGRPTELVLT
jgi:hypothetical protein